MVMVDSACEYQDRRIDEARGDRGTETQRRQLLATYARLARLARAKALLPGTPDYDRAIGAPTLGLTPAMWASRVARRTSPEYWRALRSESAASNSASSDEVAAARRLLGDMPLIVLTAGKTISPRSGETTATAQARHAAWRTMHDEIAALSTRGERRTVVDAGHGIQSDRPEAVIAAIEEVLARARAG